MTSAFDSYSSDQSDGKEQVPAEPLPKKELNGWYLTTTAVCIFIITGEKIKVILIIYYIIFLKKSMYVRSVM